MIYAYNFKCSDGGFFRNRLFAVQSEGNNMLQGLYLASQSMTTLMQKQDQIANNLANINTTGYKQSGLFTRAYQKYLADDQLRPFANREIKSDEVYIDYSEGRQIKTGNPLDFSIKGSGCFTVMTDQGIAYTRNGNFSVDKNGLLITSDGSKVMGKGGYIRIDSELPAVTVTETGEILQGNESKGELRIADFNKPYKMLRYGNGCFVPKKPDEKVVESPGYAIQQGVLEGSNVNIIKNMAQMIAAHRNFEADQRAVFAQNESLGKAVNEVGRVQ
ncbi:MAG: flagellar hook-basal body complex protein [Chitinivibrionales bacterium]|nr:flagellar hook-basal body complex protein [Chitinivibrionales bacterium]